jgi:hypothetical protein
VTADTTRAGMAAAIATGTGKTVDQADAFLDILGSAFRRRGWVDGDPLSQDAIAERLDTFLGGSS